LKTFKIQFTQKPWYDHPIIIKNYLDEYQPKSILEIETGPNLCIDQQLIKKHNIDYHLHLNNYAQTELQKGNNTYKKNLKNVIEN